MMISEYIKDRLVSYMIKAAAFIITIIFMAAYKMQPEAIIVMAVIFVITVIIIEVWDYTRKKEFYRRLNTSLVELDKKYLLAEMLEEPSFYEGKLLADTLGECNKSMAENVADYRRKSREFREYIELWVHEAKIPVAGLELMCHNNPDIDRKMLTQLKRIDDYIENVLYYARSGNPEKDYVIKEVSLKKAFGNVAVKNRDALQIIDANIETSGLDIEVMTDGKWLEFILGQFIANSLKYAAPERTLLINVYAKASDDRTILHFRDNGIGIPIEDIPYVFEKSFTGHNGRGDTHSTGMGLYIVRNLCERLGHKVTVESVQGEYTEFSLTFMKNDYYKI